MGFVISRDCIGHLYRSNSDSRSIISLAIMIIILGTDSSIPQRTGWHLRLLLLICEPLLDPLFIFGLRLGYLTRRQHQHTIWVFSWFCFWFSIWDKFIDVIDFDICLLDLLLRFWGVKMLSYFFVWSLKMDEILLRLILLLLLWSCCRWGAMTHFMIVRILLV